MKQYDGIKDEELISRFKNGESEILDYLMEKYKNMVRKKARTMFLIGGENDDLIQEGMIGLFKAVRDYQPDKDAAFQTFAGICVDRQIYNAITATNLGREPRVDHHRPGKCPELGTGDHHHPEPNGKSGSRILSCRKWLRRDCPYYGKNTQIHR